MRRAVLGDAMQAWVIAAFVLGVAQPSYADPFCDALRTVVAAAPTQFAAIRGPEQVREPNHWPRLFFYPLIIPGSNQYTADGVALTPEPCSVRALDENFSYGCMFAASPRGDEAAVEVDRFVTRVATCLNVAVPDLAGRTDARSYRLMVDNVSLSTNLLYGVHGGGMISLEVARIATAAP